MKRAITVHWDAQNDVFRHPAVEYGFEIDKECLANRILRRSQLFSATGRLRPFGAFGSVATALQFGRMGAWPFIKKREGMAFLSVDCIEKSMGLYTNLRDFVVEATGFEQVMVVSRLFRTFKRSTKREDKQGYSQISGAKEQDILLSSHRRQAAWP